MTSKPDALTLTAVFSHVALLTLAVVFCARSTVHAANVTVLDCGESDTDSFTRAHMQHGLSSQQNPQAILESHGQM